MCPSGLIKRFMGGKDVFSRKKETRAGLDRIVVQLSGREFQIDEAAKEKECRPLTDRISGTVSRCLSRDLKFRVGM